MYIIFDVRKNASLKFDFISNKKFLLFVKIVIHIITASNVNVLKIILDDFIFLMRDINFIVPSRSFSRSNFYALTGKIIKTSNAGGK